MSSGGSSVGSAGASSGSNGDAGSSATGGSGASPMGGSASGGSSNNGGGGSAAVGNGPPATGTPGVWENVTPAGMALSWDDPGGVVHHVLTDPARPMDVYAFTSGSVGVWKSTDYGTSWVRVDTGTPLTGSQRASAIDSNKARDPDTPPTLWTVNSGGGDNLWKSTNGGINWYEIDLPDVAEFDPYDHDPYSFSVDPCDGTHLIMGFHGTRELAESTDAGETWTVIETPAKLGTSVYPFFVDTGDPATTRATWLTQAQWVNWDEGIWRTSDAGASWTQVSTLEHVHGNGQMFDAGGGVIYAAGVGGADGHGIYRSSDYGVTWTRVNDGTIQNGVYGTPSFLYADYGWATSGGQGQNLQRAERDPGTEWSSYAETPAGMSNGSDHATVTFDGTHQIIVTGNWSAGIWRYVEP